MSLTTVAVAALVGCAGSLGALARYTIGRVVVERTGSAFPWATLCINVSGAFFIGLLAELTSRQVLPLFAQTVFATGFLGGYTTFSTMSWETVQLMKGGSRSRGWLYLGGNLIPGLLAASLGLLVGGWL